MRKKKTMIIIIMCVMILLMGTGYAILSTQLHINGTSNIDSSWNILITNVTSSATGRAYNISAPTYTATTMTFNVGVKEPGDKMTFTVTVKNNGNVDAILDNIEIINNGSDAIKYSISGIQAKNKLAAGASKTFTVITEFDVSATSLPDTPVKEATIKLNYIQDN